MVEIVAARRFALVVEPASSVNIFENLFLYAALPPVTMRNSLCRISPSPKSENSRGCRCGETRRAGVLVFAELRNIVRGNQRRVRLVLLPRVDRVRVLCHPFAASTELEP